MEEIYTYRPENFLLACLFYFLVIKQMVGKMVSRHSKYTRKCLINILLNVFVCREWILMAVFKGKIHYVNRNLKVLAAAGKRLQDGLWRDNCVPCQSDDQKFFIQLS